MLVVGMFEDQQALAIAGDIHSLRREERPRAVKTGWKSSIQKEG